MKISIFIFTPKLNDRKNAKNSHNFDPIESAHVSEQYDDLRFIQLTTVYTLRQRCERIQWSKMVKRIFSIFKLNFWKKTNLSKVRNLMFWQLGQDQMKLPSYACTRFERFLTGKNID